MCDRQTVIEIVTEIEKMIPRLMNSLFKRTRVYHSVDGMHPAVQVTGNIRNLLEHAIFKVAAPDRVAAD